nr:glycosyltransferase family 39 protein [Hyphomicrobium sp.]
MLSEPSCLSEDVTPVSTLRTLAQSVVHRWGLLSPFGAAFLIGVWAIVSIPSALFRGYHYVEGLTVTIAQSAMQDGNWLTPQLFNLRFIERPTLLSWIIAAMSYPFGHISPFMARLPILVSVLIGTLLVWRTLQKTARAPAAIFGAAAFLACPIVIRYYTTSVADLPLAVILFGAFLIWWNSFSSGRVTFWRWLLIGCLLAAAALLKGPQPVAYFVLGILSFS